MSAALETRKHSKPTGRGRAKSVGTGNSNFGIVASPTYRRWLHRFMQDVNQIEIADTFREAVRRWAETVDFPPPPRR